MMTATAVIICLNEFARGKSFLLWGGVCRNQRLGVMELSGSKLKEVGTTNKTNSLDYEKATNKETAFF